jgi:hypothetical protein
LEFEAFLFYLYASITSDSENRFNFGLLACLAIAKELSLTICSGAREENELVCLNLENIVLQLSKRSEFSLMLLLVGVLEKSKLLIDGVLNCEPWEIWDGRLTEQFINDWMFLLKLMRLPFLV